MPQALETYEQD